MLEAWYAILAFCVIAYAVLDGFDLGAGVLHLFVARTDPERRDVYGAIGPFWDGNEVWLLAAGGVLFAAFPHALALAFPAFYLAIFLMLWCLVLRGISIEVRGHLGDPLWRHFWDVVFAATSTLLAFLLGVAFANLVRGLPLRPDRPFTMPLFTNFWPVGEVGLLDVYTVAVGALAVCVLGGHGAAFLALRTRGPVRDRAQIAERRLAWGGAVLFAGVSAATWAVQPALLSGVAQRPWAWVAAAVAVGGVAVRSVGPWRQSDAARFVGSCATLAGVLAGAAAALWPVLLPSTWGPEFALDARGAAASEYGRSVGLWWWCAGGALAVGYVAWAWWVHGRRRPAESQGLP